MFHIPLVQHECLSWRFWSLVPSSSNATSCQLNEFYIKWKPSRYEHCSYLHFFQTCYSYTTVDAFNWRWKYWLICCTAPNLRSDFSKTLHVIKELHAKIGTLVEATIPVKYGNDTFRWKTLIQFTVKQQVWNFQDSWPYHNVQSPFRRFAVQIVHLILKCISEERRVTCTPVLACIVLSIKLCTIL